MSTKSVVQCYIDENKEKNRRELINKYFDTNTENFRKSSKNDIYSLYVLQMAEFDLFSDGYKKNQDKNLNFSNSEKTQNDVKNGLLLLHDIDIKDLSFTEENINSVFEKNMNCPIFRKFSNLFKEKQKLPDSNKSEYELQQKEKEIEKLKQKIKELQTFQSSGTKIVLTPILEKPKDFEQNILLACVDGKLSSVRWICEKENIVYNKKEGTDAPIHIASRNGHLQIVQYFIENNIFQIDIKGSNGRTPLHYACLNGRLPIVEYLISKDATIDSTDNNLRTPLHYASNCNHFDIVKFLVSKGANKNSRDKCGKTPKDLTYKAEIESLLI